MNTLAYLRARYWQWRFDRIRNYRARITRRNYELAAKQEDFEMRWHLAQQAVR